MLTLVKTGFLIIAYFKLDTPFLDTGGEHAPTLLSPNSEGNLLNFVETKNKPSHILQHI